MKQKLFALIAASLWAAYTNLIKDLEIQKGCFSKILIGIHCKIMIRKRIIEYLWLMTKNFFFKCAYSSVGLLSIFYFAIVGCFTLLHAAKALPDEAPIVETTQFELLGTDKGTLKLTIKAHEMRQYKNGNVTLAGGIEIVIWANQDAKEEGATYIQASALSYNKEQQLCMIEGNVLIRKPQKQLKMTTEQLWYNMKEEIIFTEFPIVVEHKKNLLKGNGLRATKDLKKYTINGPNGTVDIKQGTASGADLL